MTHTATRTRVVPHAILTALLLLLATLTFGTSTSAAGPPIPERPLIDIGAGTGILALHGVPQSLARHTYTCTLTAIGYDNTGALVGITNAHCFYDNFGNQWPNDAIYLERPGHPTHIDLAIGSVGRVTLIGPGNPVVPGPAGIGLDYAVIEFDRTKVRPTATIADTTVTSITTPPPPGSPVCKHGHRTGRTCGILLPGTPPYLTTSLTESPGDSGAPLTHGDALIGTLWVTSHASPITAILAELDRHRGPGAGFRLALG